MDIISHTLSGTAIGTVFCSYNKKDKKLWIILFASLGGALPDFDAFSLWSKFDDVIGKLVPLQHTGKEIYFGKFWYSHHGSLHSLIAAIGIPLLFFVISYLCINKKNANLTGLLRYFKNKKVFVLAFFLAFFLHLLEDMPTPHCVWGGVNLFFPFGSYIGGYGKIWWWNNYDIFIIITLIILINSFFLITTYLIPIKINHFCSVIFTIGFFIALYQINTRTFDFNYTGHTTKYNQYELKSKELQKEILGKKLYYYMEKFDQKISLNF